MARVIATQSQLVESLGYNVVLTTMARELGGREQTGAEASGCCGADGSCVEPPRPPMAMTAMAVNSCAHVCETCMDPRDAAMLRAMGMRPNAKVRMIRSGEPCIIEVLGINPATGSCGCRIGLSRDLASRVTVRPVAGCKQ